MTVLLKTALLAALPFSALSFSMTSFAQAAPSSTPRQGSPAGSSAPQTALPEQPTPAQQTTPKAPVDDLPDTPSTEAHLAPSPEPTGPTVVMDTTMGRLTCKLFDETPKTDANFIELAEGMRDFTDPATGDKKRHVRFYDGTVFHRVIPNFMIQGGDRAGDGTGDPGYFFEDEINPGLRFDRPGRLAMANSGPGTNGSQFFITEGMPTELNGKHTIFGQCDAHTVVMVQSIARVERNANDKPLTPVVINKVTVVRDGQTMPAEPAAPAAVGATAPKGVTAAPAGVPPASH